MNERNENEKPNWNPLHFYKFLHFSQQPNRKKSWSTYSVKPRITALCTKSGGQVNQILLKSKTQFQYIRGNKNIPENFPDWRQWNWEQVEKERHRVNWLGWLVRVRCESGAELAGELEKSDGGERGLGGADGFPLGVKGDDWGASQGLS